MRKNYFIAILLSITIAACGVFSGVVPFNNVSGLSDNAVSRINKAESAKLSSLWEWELWRDGKLIETWSDHNLCTDEGLNAILDIMFHASTQITAWYVVPFENNYTPVAGATYAAPGFTECTAYTEANRPAWNEAAASGKSITNSASKAEFSINATKNIYGAALVGGGTAANTKGDTAGGGTLYNVSQFSSGYKEVENGDTLKVTITITAQDV